LNIIGQKFDFPIFAKKNNPAKFGKVSVASKAVWMMLENGNMKQLPPSPSHSTALEEQMSEWTQARVTLWLDANGWSQVSPIFEGSNALPL
jgi:hypothetical protein